MFSSKRHTSNFNLLILGHKVSGAHVLYNLHRGAVSAWTGAAYDVHINIQYKNGGWNRARMFQYTAESLSILFYAYFSGRMRLGVGYSISKGCT